MERRPFRLPGSVASIEDRTGRHRAKDTPNAPDMLANNESLRSAGWHIGVDRQAPPPAPAAPEVVRPETYVTVTATGSIALEGIAVERTHGV
ncbi:MAG TPA: hypothetical protein VLE73_00505 [Candidatus Saccharimonadales bacterium]|nr:hypothetical protein [Candidatus Saccharimonadales bacterium]